jgi:formate/nitrite transporter FocA (FNT family)
MGGILSGRIRNHDVSAKLAAYIYICIFGNVIGSVIIGYKISVIYNSMYAEGFVETILYKMYCRRK